MNDTNQSKVILEKMIKELELPDSAYEKAIRRYEDLGDWLGRKESSLVKNDPHVFPQGSFRLGTAVKPLNNTDEYDLDIACKLRKGVTKVTHSQKQLKELIGLELKKYKDARKIQEDLKEKHRCWRLEYQDELSFHMDIVPCIPEDESIRKMFFNSMSKSGLNEKLASVASETTISITDDRHENYNKIQANWNISNPEGYAKWFEERIRTTSDTMVMEKAAAQVDDIPTYKRKKPLQRVIQLLKRHRDIMFKDDSDAKPISIIISTLASRAYSGEQDIEIALKNILQKMGSFVSSSAPRVPNPVDPGEDFADRWAMSKYKHLKLEENFWKWLKQAKIDFDAIEETDNIQLISKLANQKFSICLDESDLRKSLGLDKQAVITPTKVQIIREEPAKAWQEEK